MNAIVQNLGRDQKTQILQHLLMLAADDLRLRFGRSMSEHALQSYVDGINFGDDGLFGIFDEGPRLAAMAHVAIDAKNRCAELGLSVAPGDRRQGHGQALLRRAVLFAANRGGRVIYMHCLIENQAMVGLARKAGFKVVPDGVEADAARPLAPASVGSIIRGLMYDQVALFDHVLRHQVEFFRRAASARADRLAPPGDFNKPDPDTALVE